MRLIDADALIERVEDDIKAIEDREPEMAMGAIGVLNMIKKAPPVEPKRLPQPHKCVVYRDGECRYPIEACSECPKHEGMRAVLAERPKRKWTPCSNPPKHHRDVLVRGVEAVGNVKVHKVMQWDVDRWRPMDYSSSVTWEEWCEI